MRNAPKYTVDQIRAMLGNASQWVAQLRTAAIQLKLPVTSVTPIAEVLAALHNAV